MFSLLGYAVASGEAEGNLLTLVLRVHQALCFLGGAACVAISYSILFLVHRRMPRPLDPPSILLCAFVSIGGIALWSATLVPAEHLVETPWLALVRASGSLMALGLSALLAYEVQSARHEPKASDYQQNLEREVQSRREAELRLRSNEARYLSLIDASCSSVWVTDKQGKHILENRLSADFAAPPSAGEVLDWRRLVHPDDAKSIEARWRAGIESGRAFEAEARFARNVQGDYRACLLRAAPVQGDDGSVLEWVASLRDVDDFRQTERERRDIEQRARESQHLESLGVLAGGVAHDFNNLLVGLLGHAELIARRLEANSPMQENVNSIIEAADRAAQLCKKMLAFAGRGRFLPERCQFSTVIKSMQEPLQAAMPSNVKLTFEHRAQGPVEMNPDELGQLLQIFVTNSVEALEQRPDGAIQVVTGSRFFSAEELAQTKLGSACLAGEYAFLEVFDNGPGIPDAVLPRIFEPFFSTKFLGRGLSLAAALGVARTHSGTVDITSRPGATCARLLLPVLQAETHGQRAHLPIARQRVQGTVLVVDDDVEVRELARLTLVDIGVNVFTASSADEAVRIYRERHRQIDLVLLDLTMPGGDGATTLRAMSEIEPGVRVILTSGYLAADAIEHIGEPRVEGFVQKPWRPSALAERMSNALRRREGAASRE